MKKQIMLNPTVIYVSLCILIWSLAPTFAKLAQASMDNFQYMFFSSIVSFITILIISIYNNKIKEAFSYPRKTLLALFSLGFLNYLYYLLLYFGYKNTSGMEVLVIQYTWPVFIVVLSVFILKEQITKNIVLSVILGFIGVSLVVTKGELSKFDLSNINILFLVIIGTISFALFSVLSKNITINPINATMIYYLAASIYAYFSMMSFSKFLIPNTEEWVSILINGIFINGASYILWIKALQRSDASLIAPYIFITPILSAFFLILFFNEPILYIYFVGLAFILISGLVNNSKKNPLKQPK